MTVPGTSSSDSAPATNVCPGHPPTEAEPLQHAEALLASRSVHKALAALQDPALRSSYPDASAGGRWQCHMLLGDLACAWDENVGLRQRGSPDPHRFWDGSPLHGKRVMLRCLHGLGDAVQLLRYAPQIAEIAAHLIVEVPPPLVELAPCFVGPHEVITWGEAAPAHQPPWDTQIEIMELPYIFRSDLQTLPSCDASLRLPTPAKSALPSSSRTPRVGLVWSGGSWNPSRSVPFRFFEPLLSLSPEISLFTLQPSSSNGPWVANTGRYSLQPANISLDRLLPLATFIAGLDLVITVDTLAAHLAGALRRPVWILLQHEADWRWMLDRTDSPWYPSARLFRQSTPGDWVTPLDQVRRDLLTFSTEPSRQ